VNTEAALAPDAAMVLGIAATAMPFARTPEAEAERWLRVLRLHGEAGAALQALGVSEGSLHAHDEDTDHERAAHAGGADDRDVVAQVTENAVHIASRRGATGITTIDVLLAVMHVYGADFDRVLRAHGTDSEELLEQLSSKMGTAAETSNAETQAP
jgi:ATP-dependent Clp protease ATP-binding subunit ClpA